MHIITNTPMLYTEIFNGCKNRNFQKKNWDIFSSLAQNIDCGYTFIRTASKAVLMGSSYEYPRSMF